MNIKYIFDLPKKGLNEHQHAFTSICAVGEKTTMDQIW